MISHQNRTLSFNNATFHSFLSLSLPQSMVYRKEFYYAMSPGLTRFYFSFLFSFMHPFICSNGCCNHLNLICCDCDKNNKIIIVIVHSTNRLRHANTYVHTLRLFVTATLGCRTRAHFCDVLQL